MLLDEGPTKKETADKEIEYQRVLNKITEIADKTIEFIRKDKQEDS